MRLLIVFVLLVVPYQARAHTQACVKPSKLMHSVVRMARVVETETTDEYIIRYTHQGTAWFYENATTLVTNVHLVKGLRLKKNKWLVVRLSQAHKLRRAGESRHIKVRVIKMDRANDLALLRLQRPFQGAVALRLRTTPPKAQERLFGLGYTGGKLRFVNGSVWIQSSVAEYAVSTEMYLELADGKDRLGIYDGASGGPIFDCGGRVLAVVKATFVVKVPIPSKKFRGHSHKHRHVSTRKGKPNVVAIPIHVLLNLVGKRK